MINQIPHTPINPGVRSGPGGGNGQAEMMAFHMTDMGIGSNIWPSREPLVTFNGYSPLAPRDISIARTK